MSKDLDGKVELARFQRNNNRAMCETDIHRVVGASVVSELPYTEDVFSDPDLQIEIADTSRRFNQQEVSPLADRSTYSLNDESNVRLRPSRADQNQIEIEERLETPDEPLPNSEEEEEPPEPPQPSPSPLKSQHSVLGSLYSADYDA